MLGGFLVLGWDAGRRLARLGGGKIKLPLAQYSAVIDKKPACLSRAVYYFLYTVLHGGTYVQ